MAKLDELTLEIHAKPSKESVEYAVALINLIKPEQKAKDGDIVKVIDKGERIGLYRVTNSIVNANLMLERIGDLVEQ